MNTDQLCSDRNWRRLWVSNFSVHKNHLGLLLQNVCLLILKPQPCRSWFSRFREKIQKSSLQIHAPGASNSGTHFECCFSLEVRELFTFFFFLLEKGPMAIPLPYFCQLGPSFILCQNDLGSKSWSVYLFSALIQLLLCILNVNQVFLFSVGFLFLLSLI